MEKNRKTTIMIIAALVISIVGLGIAFAAFSTTLTINGNATVESSKWEIVFEGTTNASTLAAPTLTGSASVITAPTIKNSATEISNYSVSLATPGDSVTYNFKIHNKGDYAADVSTLTIAGVTNPSSPVSGSALVTDSSIATANANTLAVIEYKLYYTDNNNLVGQDDGKDCLEPGETENVSLRITFASVDSTDTSILPASNLTLDNLGVSILYNQCGNGSCTYEQGEPVTGGAFQNIDGAYYKYEGKSFIGTGVDNLIISENIISKAAWSSVEATQCSDGSTPTGTGWFMMCPEGTTPVFNDHPAADAANAYCTGCRLMTHAEACAWGGASTSTCSQYPPNKDKIIGKYNGSADYWLLADAYSSRLAWGVLKDGNIGASPVINSDGVRPVVSISSGATMTGSGTQGQPYVITQ